MRISRIFPIALMSLAGLTACSLPKPQARLTEDGSATFYVDKASGELRADQDLDSFSLPKSRRYNFSVCLRDTGRSKAIQNQEFQIRETGDSVKTDLNGCLNWSERVAFNYLAQSQYIQLTRHLVAEGLHRGVREIDFAINPWSHGENLPQVLDLGKTSLPKVVTETTQVKYALLGVAGSESPSRQRPLWVEDGRSFITEQNFTPKGVNLMFEARMNPSVKLSNMNGEVVYQALTSGLFKARVSLIHIYTQDQKETHRLLVQSPWLDSRMEGGYLSVRTPLSLSAIPTRGQLAVGLELTPINGPTGLLPFEGLYLVGEYDQLKSISFLKISSLAVGETPFKLSSYINASMDEVSQGNDDNYQRPKIEVAPLEFKYIRVGKETTSTRQIFFNVKACLRNGIEQKATRSQTFKVTRFRQSESEPAQVSEIKTDNSACVNWDESLTFKYFDCQRYLKGFIQIENADLGLKQRLEVAVNPWETWGVLARDLRYSDGSNPITYDCKEENRLKTQLLLDSYSYNTLSYNYDIDSVLNLSVRKKVQMKLEPKLLIYNSLSGGRSDSDKLRDGVYLFKAVVVQNKDYDTDNTYVTHTQKIVNVMNGQINTDMEFSVSDLKALGNRNNIIIAVYPVDEQKLAQAGPNPSNLDALIDSGSGLEIQPFIGPVVLNSDEQSSKPLRLLDASTMADYFTTGQIKASHVPAELINSVIAQGLTQKEQALAAYKARADKNVIARENHLDLVNLNDSASTLALRRSFGIDPDRFLWMGGMSPTPETYNRLLAKASASQGQELTDLLTQGTLNESLAKKMCLYWFNDFMTKKKALAPYAHQALTLECLRQVQADPKNFFILEKRLLVKELGGFQYLRGTNNSLSVGTSFSLSNSHSESQSRSLSLSLSAGLSYKFLEIFSLGLSGSYGLSWTTSDSQSNSNSVSVNESTSLTVQQGLFQVNLNKYEQCVSLRLNPLLFIKDTSSAWYNRRRDFISSLNKDLSDEDKALAVTQGIMICAGQDQQGPLQAAENYYLINQDVSGSQMQDMGDARNRNFFIALRGSRDYARFLSAIKSGQQGPQSTDASASPQAEREQFMMELFKQNTPSSPGSLLLQ